MKARTLLCDCCGAALIVLASATRVRCEYCGTLAVIELPAKREGPAQHLDVGYLPAADVPPSAPRALPSGCREGQHDAGPWAVIATAALVIVCVLGLAAGQAVVGAMLLIVLALFFGGTLLFVSAHLLASQSTDSPCEDRPVEARPRDEFARAGNGDDEGPPTG